MFVSLKKILALPIILVAVSVAALDTNYNPDTNIADTLLTNTEQIRYVFNPNSSNNILTICGLQTGEDYYLSSFDVTCIDLQNPDYSIPENSYYETNFKALGTCREVTLYSAECHPKPKSFDLSIQCQSCFDSPSANLVSSIITNPDFSPQTLIEDVFVGGDCFEVVPGSINFSGSPDGLGFFSNGTDAIDIEEGIIISTGHVNNAVGPNSSYNRSTALISDTYDQDLLDMQPLATYILDVAILEFDFIPTSNTISFEFVFASEEYCEYAGSLFNDVFGFFISGPGINGPFLDNAENIAFIPGTTDYITINSVNYYSNDDYYVDNIPSWQWNILPPSLSCFGHTQNDGQVINDIEFDGFTEVLTAQATVEPCEVYHIKLAISDVTDRYFDSAVFLKANSFNAGGQAIVSGESPGTSDNVVLEGCTNGQFVFERTGIDNSDTLTVSYTVSPMSTATEGLDYEAFPLSITILPGEDSAVLPITIFNDNINETNEILIIELDAPCSCDLPFSELTISDIASLTVQGDEYVFCESESTNLEPNIIGGQGAFSYLWNTNDTTSNIQVEPTETTTYMVTVTDECGSTGIATSTVTILESVSATISGYAQVCPEDQFANLSVEFTGSGPWSIEYRQGSQPPVFVNNITDNPFSLEVSEIGTYYLNSVFDNGCEGDIAGVGSVVNSDLSLTYQSTEVTCPGEANGSIALAVIGGLAPYSYDWDHLVLDDPNPRNLEPGEYVVTVTDGQGCTLEELVTIELRADVPIANAGTDATLNCYDTSVELQASGSTGNNYSTSWSTVDGNILLNGNSFNPEINGAGEYVLWVLNTESNCVIRDTLMVDIDTIAPIPLINTLGALELNCAITSTSLDATGSQPLGLLDFEWTTVNGEIEAGTESTPVPQVNSGGDYILEIVNTSNGCVQSSTASVQSDVELPAINILPAEIINCKDSIIELNANQSDSTHSTNILWTTQNGNLISEETSLSPLVNETGTYYLTVYNNQNNCGNIDSVVVSSDLSPPLIDAGEADDLDCTILSVYLSGEISSSTNNYVFNWTTDSGNIINDLNSLSPEVNSDGSYILEVTDLNNGCSAKDSVSVLTNEDRPELILVDLVEPECFGERGTLTILEVEGGVGPYLFSITNLDQSFSPAQIFDLPPGQYDLVTQDANGCEYNQLIEIAGVEPVSVDLVPEVEINLGESYEILAQTNLLFSEIDSIHWTPSDSLSCNDCLTPMAWPLFNTAYAVTVWDEKGCPATDEILLRVRKDRNVFIPNIFTPNNDGTNDIFHIFADVSTVKEIKSFQVYSRWGEKVFEDALFQPNNPAHGWDGRLKDQKMIPGVFAYFAEIEFIDGVTLLFEGDVTLKR